MKGKSVEKTPVSASGKKAANKSTPGKTSDVAKAVPKRSTPGSAGRKKTPTNKGAASTTKKGTTPTKKGTTPTKKGAAPGVKKTVATKSATPAKRRRRSTSSARSKSASKVCGHSNFE